MTTTTNTTVVDISIGRDTTILPPKPNYMITVYAKGPGANHLTKQFMTLDDAIWYGTNTSGVDQITFTLPNGERCRLVRYEPNWLMWLFGYTTKWVLEQTYFS